MEKSFWHCWLVSSEQTCPVFSTLWRDRTVLLRTQVSGPKIQFNSVQFNSIWRGRAQWETTGTVWWNQNTSGEAGPCSCVLQMCTKNNRYSIALNGFGFERAKDAPSKCPRKISTRDSQRTNSQAHTNGDWGIQYMWTIRTQQATSWWSQLYKYPKLWIIGWHLKYLFSCGRSTSKQTVGRTTLVFPSLSFHPDR